MTQHSQSTPFSWSHSRDTTLAECARRYGLHYYTAQGGHRPGAPEAARQAWRLKQLTTLDIEFGKLVHAEALRCTEAALAGKALPTPDEVVDRVRARLQQLCQKAKNDFGRFLADPRTGKTLQSVYYRGGWDAREVNRVTKKIRRCAARLCRDPLWDQIRGMHPEQVMSFEMAPQLLHPEFGTVYSAPDLLLIDEEEVIIIDFKTGGAEAEAARPQLEIAGWFVPQFLGIPLSDRLWIARTIGLNDGSEDEFEVTPRVVSRAEERIRDSLDWMREYVEVPHSQNRPKPLSEFPLPRPDLRPRTCRHCPFLEACAGQLQREGGAGLPNPLWKVIPRPSSG